MECPSSPRVVGCGIRHFFRPAPRSEHIIFTVIVSFFVLSAVQPRRFRKRLTAYFIFALNIFNISCKCSVRLFISHSDFTVVVHILYRCHILVKLTHITASVSPHQIAVFHSVLVCINPYGRVNIFITMWSASNSNSAVNKRNIKRSIWTFRLIRNSNSDRILNITVVIVFIVSCTEIEIILCLTRFLICIRYHLTCPSVVTVFSPRDISLIKQYTSVTPIYHIL